jgi:hypothetical protein
MKPDLRRFWSSDRSLVLFLVLLGVMLFVVLPMEELGLVGRGVIMVSFSLILVSGVGAVAKSRAPTLLVGGLVVANLAVHGLSFWSPGFYLAAWEATVSLVFCGVMALVVLVQVFREGPITAQRIGGAVAVYLLLGLGWAFAYRLIAIAWPDAFAFPAGAAVALDEGHTWRLVYFSFVTLTTVGFGDILAAHPVARSLVVCEALVGQLFPAILLARLVSMEIYHRQSRNR